MKCDVLNYKAYTLCVSKYGSKGVRWGVKKCLPVCIRSALKPVCVRNSDVLRGGTTDFDKRWVSHSLCFFPSQYWHYSSLVTFGCRFGNCCYGCKVLQNALFPSSVVKQNANGQSASKPVDYGDGWFKEFVFHQSYTGSYPGYIDLPEVHRTMTGDSRHETCLTEGHQRWN